MRPSPALLAYVEMLTLPAFALETLIERELADNPALERVETAGTWIETGDVPAASSPREQLLADVVVGLPSDDRRLAEYIVGSLDERGLLDLDDADLARALGVEVTHVRRVLDVVRSVGPAGVGARDVREGLVLQLERYGDEPIVVLARRIVERHLEELAHGRDEAIAAQIGVSPTDVAEARDFIRSRLRPYVDLGPSSPAPPLVADIVVAERTEEPGTYDVQLAEDERYGLALNPLYERLAAEGGSLSPEEHARVLAQVAQARAFVERVERRRATLRRVAELVVARQREFLRRGSSAIVSLTRADIAHELGLHESTVCRAVANRCVRLPRGRIIPFSDFFRRSLGPEEALLRLVADEERPRSDSELAAELAARGFRVARRTVAKYRGRLGILPYALR
jgi:RNA polymerase sigma-54 factor